MAKGKFKLPNGGEATIASRSVDTQTELIIKLMNLEAANELTKLGLGTEEFQRDTTAAIDELAHGDDLEPIKRRLAAQIIQDDAIASHLNGLGLALMQRRSDTAIEQGFSALRTATKFRDSSRKGLVALAEIKRPKKTTFIAKQQNLAVVQTEKDDRNIKQIEGNDHGRVDFGTTASGKGTDATYQTVEVINRPKKRRGKSDRQSEQLEIWLLQ